MNDTLWPSGDHSAPDTLRRPGVSARTLPLAMSTMDRERSNRLSV
jgi:hypothetical protein